jgi:hypothetical protein
MMKTFSIALRAMLVILVFIVCGGGCGGSKFGPLTREKGKGRRKGEGKKGIREK